MGLKSLRVSSAVVEEEGGLAQEFTNRMTK